MNRNAMNLGALGAGLFVLGVIVIGLGGLQAYQQYLVLRAWTPVAAEFVRTDVRNEKFDTRVWRGRADRYVVTWIFHYKVGAVECEAVADPDVHGTYAQMAAWIYRFHPGERVTIHYNPENPGEISAAAYDWATFAHATWVGLWGLGIAIVGFFLRRFADAHG